MFWDQTPVLVGKPVTFAADVQGDGVSAPQLTLGFRDAAGTIFDVRVSEGAATHAGTQRVRITATAPAGAASVAVGAQGSVKALTRPQVTWRGHDVPWTTGKGCKSAVVMNADSALVLSSGRRGAVSHHDPQVTIQELT